MTKKKTKPSAADVLIDKRNQMKQVGTQDLNNIEAQIAQIILKEEVNKAQQFVTYCNLTGTISLQKMWKLKKELWPKKKASFPVAKISHTGRLISSPKELMQLLKNEYKDRLRPRPYKSYLKNHMQVLHEVTKLKLSRAWSNKSPAFSMDELTKGLKDLNKGKARDPGGLCSEIFQPNVIGASMKESLLTMLNSIKEEGLSQVS